MRPPTPDEMLRDNKELPEEGMMFIGDGGIILTGPNIQSPQVISGKKSDAAPSDTASDRKEQEKKLSDALPRFVQAVKAGKQYPGSFPEAEHLTEAVNLYAAALRSNKVLHYDAASVKISSPDNANQYLKRDYRAGWDINTI